MSKVLYRYVDDKSSNLLSLVEVNCKKYNVIKETEKSYLINIYNHSNSKYGNKYVLKTTSSSRKRYAYDTKEAALVNYITRRRKQIKLLTYQLREAEEGLKQAVKIREEMGLEVLKEYIKKSFYYEF